MIMPFCWKMYFLNYFYVLFKFEIICREEKGRDMVGWTVRQEILVHLEMMLQLPHSQI